MIFVRRAPRVQTGKNRRGPAANNKQNNKTLTNSKLNVNFNYSTHEALVLKESERKWEEGLISVFQLMEARNRFISAKAELVRVRLQVEMMRKLEKYYREGTFL